MQRVAWQPALEGARGRSEGKYGLGDWKNSLAISQRVISSLLNGSFTQPVMQLGRVPEMA